MRDEDFVAAQDELLQIAVFSEGVGLETPIMLVEQDMRQLERNAVYGEATSGGSL